MDEKIVFILGAGFSKEAEAPLINEFLQKAKDIYANQDERLRDYERGFFEKVFKYYSSLSTARLKVNFDIDNIEDFFSILDINITTSQDPSLKEIREALIYLIIKTLDISINEQKYKFYDNFLKELYNKSFKLSFLSFNYDLVLERSLDNGNCSFNYCADPDRIPIKDTETKVLKLHGSSNWLFCNSCSNLSILGKKVLGDLYNQNCKKCGEKVTPLLIPPTWNKQLGLPYFKNVWHSAFEEIKSANKIIIIGYSLPETDIYFRHFLSLSLKDNNRLRKIIVVDPNKQIRNKYNSFLESNFYRRYFSFIETYFEPRSHENGITVAEIIDGAMDPDF